MEEYQRFQKVGLFFFRYVGRRLCPLWCRMCVVCLVCVVSGISFLNSYCLCVFFAPGFEFSPCLSYVFWLKTITFHMVHATIAAYVCGMFFRLKVVLSCVFGSVCYLFVYVF
jgi:hypothetical protein